MNLVINNPDTWLRENYAKYSNATLAKMLGLKTERAIQHRLKRLGLSKKADPSESLTKEQQLFISENYSERTVKEMVIELNASGGRIKISTVVGFLKKERIKKYANLLLPPKKKGFLRAKADHQNANHEDRVNYWATLVIEPNRKYSSSF